MINTIVGEDFKEDEPTWLASVSLPRVDEINALVKTKNDLLEATSSEITVLEIKRNEIEKHKKLLWTYDTTLEDAVNAAFVTLGFNEIRPGRSKELEDLVMDIKHSGDYELFVLEVKGREKRTSMGDMNQTDKWVKQYRVKEEKKVKGVFVSCQFRRTEPLESEKRIEYSDNEIEFAQDFGLSILPTAELFNAVKKHLNGEGLTREQIESRLLSANPICNLTS